MHLRAAQALFLGVFAGGHLDQWRPTQKHLGLAADHDVVVAHAGLVGAACGGGAKHHRDGRDAQLGQLGDLVEQPAALGEVANLAADRRLGVAVTRIAAQVGAGGFDELDIGHAVDARDLQAAHQLLGVKGVEGAGPHRRVVTQDHALDALDHADADDEARADVEAGSPGRHRADFEERRIAVQHQRNALAQWQLAALAQPGLGVGATALGGFGLQRAQHGQAGQHRAAVGLVALVAGVELGGQNRHGGPGQAWRGWRCAQVAKACW